MQASALFSEEQHKVHYETRDSRLHFGFGVTFLIPFQVIKVSKLILTVFYFPIFLYNNDCNMLICLLHAEDFQLFTSTKFSKGFHLLLGDSNYFSRALGTETVQMEKLGFFVISTFLSGTVAV